MANGKYATQGGGIAILNDYGQYIFIEVPSAEFSVGDTVPCDWGLEGPFDENWKLMKE